MMTSAGGNIFRGSGLTNYARVFVDLGPWIDAGRRPCHLVSIDASGVLQRTVEPATAARADWKPVAHFGLAPLVEPRTGERRCDADRRQGERQAGEHGAGDRRQDERRRPQPWRYASWRAPN